MKDRQPKLKSVGSKKKNAYLFWREKWQEFEERKAAQLEASMVAVEKKKQEAEEKKSTAEDSRHRKAETVQEVKEQKAAQS